MQPEVYLSFQLWTWLSLAAPLVAFVVLLVVLRQLRQQRRLLDERLEHVSQELAALRKSILALGDGDR